MKAYIGISFILLVVLHVSCERLTQPRVENQAEVHLTEVATLVQDTYLRLQVSGAPAGSVLRVYRNEALWIEHPYTEKDSLLHDIGLPPGSQLTYRAEIVQSGVVIGRSAPLSVQLLDTTSHQVQWEVYEFDSPYGSGNLSDVAIVSEDNIWVVGEIYNDSVKTWLRYNALHWNGKLWELERLTVKFRNSYISPPGEGIYPFTKNNIWVTLGGAPVNWDGNSWKLFHLWDMGVLEPEDGGVTKIWGSSPDDIYFVGRGGTIVHYDGSNWQRIESGTETIIQDIFGDASNNNSLPEILAIASDFYHRPGSELIRIDGDAARIIADSTELQRGLAGIWFSAGREYWLVGDGVFRARLQPHNWELIRSFPAYFAHGIGGTDVNDIWVVGAFGLVSHFNGKSWHHYMGSELPKFFGNLYRVAVTESIIVIVGQVLPENSIDTSGIIIIGKR